jgi:hypothetical protein
VRRFYGNLKKKGCLFIGGLLHELFLLHVPDISIGVIGNVDLILPNWNLLSTRVDIKEEFELKSMIFKNTEKSP